MSVRARGASMLPWWLFLITGIAVKTGPGDNFPVQQGQLQRWTNGRWVPFGGIWQSKRN